MEIKGPEGLGGARDVQPPRRPAKTGAREGASRAEGNDKVEISSLGRYKAIVSAAPPVRADRVAEIREKIRKGGYPTDELLSQAFDRMVSEETGGG